jgi:hypothetical protein
MLIKRARCDGKKSINMLLKERKKEIIIKERSKWGGVW